MIHPDGLFNFTLSLHTGVLYLLIPLTSELAQLDQSLTRAFLDFSQCFDCQADLGGSEAGAEVRIRNKQLYCNICYMRFKSEYSIDGMITVWLSWCNLIVSGSAATPTAMWPDCTPPDRWRNYLWQQSMIPLMKKKKKKLIDEKFVFCFVLLFVIGGLSLQFIVFITYEVAQTQKWEGSACNRVSFFIHLRHKTSCKMSLSFFFSEFSQDPEMREFRKKTGLYWLALSSFYSPCRLLLPCRCPFWF